MMESTRAEAEALRLLCDNQKDELSYDFRLLEEDVEDIDASNYNENADEHGEPEPTTSGEKAHSTTPFKFKVRVPSYWILRSSYSFQAKLEAQNVTEFLDVWSLLFPEDILEFEGNFEARVNISNIKDDYDVQIIFLNNAEVLYRINVALYVGPDEKTESESEQSYYICKLSKPLHKTERNITCDNWFTFVDIVEKIKKEDLLTIVDALSKEKIGDLLSCIDTALIRNPHFVYLNDHILVSYSPKSYKVALFILSSYKIKEIGGENQLKMISFYNWTKGCSKMFHKACQTYLKFYENKSNALRIFFDHLDRNVMKNSTIIKIGKGHLNPLEKEEEDQADIRYSFFYRLLTKDPPIGFRREEGYIKSNTFFFGCDSSED